MDKLGRLVWAASTTLKVGPYHIGIRSNTEETDALVRDAFSTLVDDSVEAPPNYSVILSPEGIDNGSRRFHFLYENHTSVVRTRHPGRVMTALWAYLSAHQENDESEQSLINVKALALVRDGEAILAPIVTLSWVEQLSPRLHRRGVQFLDSPQATIDPKSAELVVQSPSLPMRAVSHFEKSASLGSGKEPPPATPGRYPIKGWAFYTPQGDEHGRLSPGLGVFSSIRSLETLPDIAPTSSELNDLGNLFTQIDAVAIASPYEGDLASNLVAVFDYEPAATG